MLLMVIAVLVAVVLALLIALLRGGPSAPTGAAPPAGPAQPAAPAAPPGPTPTPTLPIVVNGYRYTIGVGPLTPTVEVGHQYGQVTSAPPGRHYLIGQMVIRNDNDRTAPALVDSNGDALSITVGLSPVAFLPPVHSLGIPAGVSDCANDPRNPKVFTNPNPLYKAITPQTCIVNAGVTPAHPVGSFEDDSQLPPGGQTLGRILTIDLPDDVPVTASSVWLVTDSAPSPDGPYSVLDRVPTS